MSAEVLAEVQPSYGSVGCLVGQPDQEFGVRYEGEHQVLFFGFGLDAVTSELQQQRLLRRSLAWFGQTGAAGITSFPPISGLRLSTPSANPFRARTEIVFTLPASAEIDLAVRDVTGRRLATLIHGRCGSGAHHTRWGGNRADGTPVPPGIYWVRLTAGDQRRSRRALVLR